MFAFVIVIHVIVSLVLVGVILLQAGRGDISDAFGGGAATRFLGTGAATFLARATTVCAILFILTSLTLAIMSSHSARSLVDRVPVKIEQKEPLKPSAAAKPEESKKDETPKAQ